MTNLRKAGLLNPVEFQTTRPSKCSYLDGKIEQRLAADISSYPNRHDSLSRAGFRRVENWVYKPICAKCNACKPIRIAAGNGTYGRLQISRNQKRVLRRNADLTRNILPNYSKSEHFELFHRYLDTRHNDGQMAGMDETRYADMISISPIETVLFEYMFENQLVGVMLVDLQSDGLSAVYSFFEPDMEERSLGTFMVLDLAAAAAEMKLDYVYLGYFVSGSSKMEYKSRFTPAEIMEDGYWIPVEK